MSHPIDETIDLYKWLSTEQILGFNLSFDIFKIQQQMTTLMLLGHRVGKQSRPIDFITEYALCEPQARDGPVFKPRGAMDLMLHARKGPWQNLMARDPIVIRRVPIGIAPLVLQELERRITVPDIFFAKRKDKSGTKWKIKRIKTADGENPDFVNIELNFAPSSALKALYTHEAKLDPSQTLVFSDVEVDRRFLPVENGSAPYALSIGKPGRWNGAWPDVVKQHHDHWLYNDLAREYAFKDIVYPRWLYNHWGRPAFNDDDSILACLAGATRWKGFSVNVNGMKKLNEQATQKMSLAPRAPRAVMEYLQEVLSPEEQVVLKDTKSGSLTTKRVVLEEIRKLKCCHDCLDGVKHDVCVAVEHPAAERANKVLASRQGKKEKEVYDKLIEARRFHVSVNVIGARSSRQSGGQVTEGKKVKKSGSINPQGINKKKVVREQFPLAFTLDLLKALADDMKVDLAALGVNVVGSHLDEWASIGFPLQEEIIVGGDFDKFEVCITDAYYQDPQLHADLVGVEPPCERDECRFSNLVDGEFIPHCSRCTGVPSKPGSVKIHAIIGTLAYPGRSYWDIRATDGKDRDETYNKKGQRVPGLKELFPDWPLEHWVDLYTRSKSAFFALIYFGNEDTLASRLGIPKEDGLKVFNAIMARFPVMASKRNEFYESFCPVRQPEGGQVFWVEPDDFVESMLRFPRFFTLENQIINALYLLAEDVPSEWQGIKVKVMRKAKLQTVAGAVRSSLYGAAFGLQGANMRAAGNHKIQSTGAGFTKQLQRRIWDHQPCGVHPWYVRSLNVHDELPTTVHPDYEERVAATQAAFILEKRALIPLLAMKWKRMGTWAGK